LSGNTRQMNMCALSIELVANIGRWIFYDHAMTELIRIIGIDPGLRRTGWGIIETIGNSLRFVASGTVTSDGEMDLASRLCQLHDGLAEIVHSYQPHEAAVEQTFVNKDAVATLKLGQARGVAMLVPARAGLQVSEYAPNAVKKSVIGVGHGEKQQIHMMLKVLMPKAEFKGNDAADALAIAVCHAHHRGSARSRLAALTG
jgi:crossover junction endodeoxyribonuclease RuvC